MIFVSTSVSYITVITAPPFTLYLLPILELVLLLLELMVYTASTTFFAESITVSLANAASASVASAVAAM